MGLFSCLKQKSEAAEAERQKDILRIRNSEIAADVVRSFSAIFQNLDGPYIAWLRGTTMNRRQYFTLQVTLSGVYLLKKVDHPSFDGTKPDCAGVYRFSDEGYSNLPNNNMAFELKEMIYEELSKNRYLRVVNPKNTYGEIWIAVWGAKDLESYYQNSKKQW